jgi:predicted secreted protein
MHALSAVAIYFVVWWIVLFAVLPWGTRPVADPDSQTGWRGAPVRPSLGRKVIATTILAAIVWGLIIAAFEYDLLDLRAIQVPND